MKKKQKQADKTRKQTCLLILVNNWQDYSSANLKHKKKKDISFPFFPSLIGREYIITHDSQTGYICGGHFVRLTILEGLCNYVVS